MTLTRDEGWQHLCEWPPGDALRKHARAVELVMRAVAPVYGGPDAAAAARLPARASDGRLVETSPRPG